MKQTVCAQCGSTNFNKEEGVFICQSCGAQYSIREAMGLMKEVEESPFAQISGALNGTQAAASPFAQIGAALKDNQSSPAPESSLAQMSNALKGAETSSFGNFAGSAAGSFDALKNAAGNPLDALKENEPNPLDALKNAAGNPLDALMNPPKQESAAFNSFDNLGSIVAGAFKGNTFDPMAFATQANDPQLINDYVCRGWSKALAAYEDIEHPDQEEQQKLVAVAKDCLAALNRATMFDVTNYTQTAVLYGNCRQVIRAVKNTYYYTQNDDGAWKRNSLPLSTDFKVVGQSESWDKVYEKFESMLEQEYYSTNPADLEARSQLAAQEAQLTLELDELKTEKKSHGFFDFSGKREVKGRMAPIKDQLGDIRSQMNAISRRAHDYAELKIDEYARANSFERLA